MTLLEEPGPDTLLSLRGVSKKFCRGLKRSLFYAALDVSSDVVRGRRASDRLRKGEFWALGDISFELKRGQALGLVGSNGSGKTTLLRLIAGLIKPDAGSIEVRGRLAPLIALGAGFNPILTGRENIVVNLSILGLSRAEIKVVFDAVIDFAEIEEAIDAPLRTYSSGMAARLGFACAMQVRPDILLVDEVLAVGDIRFRVKCYRKIAELKQNGTAFILVSHNPNLILSNCDICLLIQGGKMAGLGEPKETVQSYERLLLSGSSCRHPNKLVVLAADGEKTSAMPLRIKQVFFRDAGDQLTDSIKTGQDVSLCIQIAGNTPIEDLRINIMVRGKLDEMGSLQRLASQPGDIDAKPGESEIRLFLSGLIYGSGDYTMKISINDANGYMYDAVEQFDFTVSPEPIHAGSRFYQKHRWGYVQI